MAPNGSTNQEFQVWQERWNGLKTKADQMQAFYAGIDADKLPRKQTLLALLKGLEDFAEQQFNFFYNGFGSGKFEIDQYPPEHVFAVLCSQIGFDLAMLERAIEQRLTGSQQELATLKNADKLAWMAIRPALGNVIPADTTVLMYFQKSTEIRIVPYANVAAIGIPYSAIDVPIDFLAIAHEAGHRVFWSRKESTEKWWNAKGKSRYNSNIGFKDWWGQTFDHRHWYEETFADVYGCLVAGPVIAYDFQELALEQNTHDFADLNQADRHPTPVLRPRIYHKVLFARDNQTNQWAEAAERLEKRWTELQRVKNSQPVTVSGISVLSSGPTLSINSPVDKLIYLALEQLAEVQPDADWSGDVASLTDISKLGDQFKQQYLTLLQNTRLSPPELDITNSWSDWGKRFEVDLTKSYLKENEWCPVFQAEGWTTGGPQTDPAH